MTNEEKDIHNMEKNANKLMKERLEKLESLRKQGKERMKGN